MNRATLATGELFAPLLTQMCDELNGEFGTQLRVARIENRYFGGDVGVAGLMTGSDLLAARDRIGDDKLILPSAAFKSDEPVMLDGMTLDDLQRRLGIPLQAADLPSLIHSIEA